MTLIRVPEPHRPVIELESEGSFAAVMQQADHGPGDQRRRVRGVIYVSDDGQKWRPWRTVWEGYWRPSFEGGLPTMDPEELRHLAAPSGCRFAEFRYCSTLEYRR